MVLSFLRLLQLTGSVITRPRVQDLLYDARRRNGKELTFRVQLRPRLPQVVPVRKAADKVAIATTGVATFTPAGTNSTIADLKNSRIAVGHFIVVGNKQFRIVSIKGTPEVVTVHDESTNKVPTSAVTAADYTIMNPRWQVDANAHVTQTGSFSASTDGNPVGDSFSLQFINNLPNWTPIFT